MTMVQSRLRPRAKRGGSNPARRLGIGGRHARTKAAKVPGPAVKPALDSRRRVVQGIQVRGSEVWIGETSLVLVGGSTGAPGNDEGE